MTDLLVHWSFYICKKSRTPKAHKSVNIERQHYQRTFKKPKYKSKWNWRKNHQTITKSGQFLYYFSQFCNEKYPKITLFSAKTKKHQQSLCYFFRRQIFNHSFFFVKLKKNFCWFIWKFECDFTEKTNFFFFESSQAHTIHISWNI